MALLGLNGSGKTTLRIASGLLEATKGQVVLAGHAAGLAWARAAVSYIPDNPVLYDDLERRGAPRVCRPSATARRTGEPYAAELVTRLGLDNRIEDLPSSFSRGLRQKVSIALAFVRPFEVLLVDEPFVGLDVPGRETLLELLAEAAGRGGGGRLDAPGGVPEPGGPVRRAAGRQGHL